MRREALLLALSGVLLAAGCSRLERLSVVRPTAERGEYTRVSPVYDVSDRGRGKTPATAAMHLAMAAEMYGRGALSEAQAEATRALKANPRSPDSHALLAAIADARGDAAAAGRHYQQAQALAPGIGSHANNYGTWLCANGRAADSLDWFAAALADPGYQTRAAALANAGTCASRAGLPVRAEAAWRQALELEPGNPAALAALARLAFARGAYLDARAFSQRRLAAAAADPETLQLASQIELKLGDTAASSRYLHQLQSASPGEPPAPRPQ
jgi:type IV pilus assembly protein PilF